MATIVRVSDVSKRFNLHHDKSLKERLVKFRRQSVEDFWALRNVGFELEESQTLGLIGANGSGKSTLLKIIAGILSPTTGFVERRGRMAALLELGAGFHPDLTGRENIYMNASILGLTRRQTDAYFDRIVEFSGIEPFIDNQVKFYSSGMYVRLAFSVAVHVEPEILLIDEVLAVGDEPFQRKCMTRIKQFQQEGRTIILVTHGIDTVRELCDRGIMLEKGELVIDGKPQEVARTFRERYAPEASKESGDERGNRQVTIVDLTVTDGHGNAKDRFEAGEEFGIEYTLVAPEPVDDPVAGIAIHNHVDSLIYGTNTNLRSVSLGRVEGKVRVCFNLGSIPMVEGQYFVTAAVHSRDGITDFHWLERQAAFRVFSDGDPGGAVHLSPKIDFREVE